VLVLATVQNVRYYDDDDALAAEAESTSGRLRSGSAAVALSGASARHAQQQAEHLCNSKDCMMRRRTKMLSLPRAVRFANKQRAAARSLTVSAWKTSMDSPSRSAASTAVSATALEEAEEEDSEAPKMRRKVFMACKASCTCALSNTTVVPCNTPPSAQVKTRVKH